MLWRPSRRIKCFEVELINRLAIRLRIDLTSRYHGADDRTQQRPATRQHGPKTTCSYDVHHGFVIIQGAVMVPTSLVRYRPAAGIADVRKETSKPIEACPWPVQTAETEAERSPLATLV